MSTQKKFIITASNKGGVGKSMTASLLVDAYKKAGTKAAFYDADGTIGALYRMFKNDVTAYNARDEKEIRNLLNSLKNNDSDVVLHDMPGGSMSSVLQHINGDSSDESADTFVETVERAGYQLVILHVLSFDYGSVRSVNNVMKSFGISAKKDDVDGTLSVSKESWAENVQHVACVNLFASEHEEDFPYWFTQSNNVREVFLASGGIEFKLPRLRPGVVAQVQFEGQNWQDATNAKTTKLDLNDETVVVKFLKRFRSALNDTGADKAMGLTK
ncbi:hypothetical protein [Acetobacter orientalis]|uniref:nucleotide-binding protein n=1 Tax=Acetobacter orientalis TaxID=146474 RepID=UPI0039E996D6